MQTITEAVAQITANDISIEAWNSDQGVEGVIWDDGQEGPTFTAESFDAIEAATIAAGFDHRVVEDNMVSRTLVADWRSESVDGIESAFLKVTR